MKRLLCVVSCLFAGMVSAAMITDTFDGTALYNPDASVSIGANWVNPLQGVNAFTVARKTDKLRFDAPTASTNYFIYNTGLAMTAGAAGDASSWTYSADVEIKPSGVYAGLVFNVQDVNNYYILRVRSATAEYQVAKVINGAISAAFSGSDLSAPIALDQQYTFTVSCDAAGLFNFTITQQGSSTVLNPTTTATVSSAFDGGYAGLYLYHGKTATYSPEASFDNFNLNVVPEPATIGLFGISALILFCIRRSRRV